MPSNAVCAGQLVSLWLLQSQVIDDELHSLPSLQIVQRVNRIKGIHKMRPPICMND